MYLNKNQEWIRASTLAKTYSTTKHSGAKKFNVLCPNFATCLHGYVARVSVDALADQYSDMISDRFQRVNTGLHKRSAIIRGKY